MAGLLQDFISDLSRLLEHFQDLQIRPQKDRLQILELLNDLMLQHRAALKDMGQEFVVGVTDLVSGEKDPRNLMIIFSVLKAVMVEWDISAHAEVCISPLPIPFMCSLHTANVRFCLLLLPDHISTSAERSLWDNCTGLEGTLERLYSCVRFVRAFRLPSIDRKTR